MRAHRRSRIVAAEGLSAAQEGSSPHLAKGSSSPSAAPDRVAPEGSSPTVAGCTRVLIAGPRSLSLEQGARRWTKELVAAPESSPLELVAAPESLPPRQKAPRPDAPKSFVAAPESVPPRKRARHRAHRRLRGLVASSEGRAEFKGSLHKRARRCTRGSSLHKRARRCTRGSSPHKWLVAAQEARRRTSQGSKIVRRCTSWRAPRWAAQGRGLVAAQEARRRGQRKRAHRRAAQEGSSQGSKRSCHRTRSSLHHSVCGQVTERSLEKGPSPEQRAYHVHTRELIAAPDDLSAYLGSPHQRLSLHV